MSGGLINQRELSTTKVMQFVRDIMVASMTVWEHSERFARVVFRMETISVKPRTRPIAPCYCWLVDDGWRNGFTTHAHCYTLLAPRHLLQQSVYESARGRHYVDVMSREQQCLVYSIDAILGLTGNGQRSSSTTAGRRKCRESSDVFELQQNATTSHNGPPGIQQDC